MEFYLSTDWLGSLTYRSSADRLVDWHRKQYQRQTETRSRKTEFQKWEINATVQEYKDGPEEEEKITRGLSWKRWEKKAKEDSKDFEWKFRLKKTNLVGPWRNWTDDELKHWFCKLERKIILNCIIYDRKDTDQTNISLYTESIKVSLILVLYFETFVDFSLRVL